MLAAPEDDAAHRTDVAVVAPPGEDDMLLADDEVVGRVDVDPAYSGAIDRGPGMRGVGAGEARPSRRRVCADVAADITSGEAERAQRRDFGMGEILADAALRLDDLGEQCRQLGPLRAEGELAVDAPRMGKHRLARRHAGTAGEGDIGGTI